MRCEVLVTIYFGSGFCNCRPAGV